jgi:hypothetical protein
MPGIVVTVTPAAVTLGPAQSQQFTAWVAGAVNAAVRWSIQPSVGAVSPTGLYTAPATINLTQTVTVTATSVENPARSGSATVTLKGPIVVTVSPASVTLQPGQSQQFTATVTGASNPAVIWSVQPPVGTISPNGLYVAPETMTTPQTVTVTATSAEDPTRSGSATVSLLVPFTVAVTPEDVIVSTGEGVQFSVIVTGASSWTVSWNVLGFAGGAPAVGTITKDGFYTAPSQVPSVNPVWVEAVVTAATTKSARANVTIVPSGRSAPASPPASLPDSPGGLASRPCGEPGRNLLWNPGFEQKGPDGEPAGWSGAGFRLDNVTRRTGAFSYRVADAGLSQDSPGAGQILPLGRGIYQLSGWVKTEALGVGTGSGAALCLSTGAGEACTPVLQGTTGWQELKLAGAVVAQGGIARFRIASCRGCGAVWFDDLELRRLEIPLAVFPADSGGRPETARFTFSVDPPAGASLPDYRVRATLTDETDGAPLAEMTWAASTAGVADLDLSPFPPGRSYLAAFRLESAATGAPVCDYPPFRLRKEGEPGAAPFVSGSPSLRRQPSPLSVQRLGAQE